MGGGQATVWMAGIMGKRLEVHGTMLRGRSSWEKAAATDAFRTQVVPLLAAGTVAPVIDAVLPLADAAQAYELLASDTTFGKVILRPWGGRPAPTIRAPAT